MDSITYIYTEARFYTPDAAATGATPEPPRSVVEAPSPSPEPAPPVASPGRFRQLGASLKEGVKYSLTKARLHPPVAALFATGTMAFIAGSISNYRWPDEIAFGPVHLASRHLAKAVLEVAKCVLQLGAALGKAGVAGLLAFKNVIASHPMLAFKMAGIGTVAYLAIRQIALVGREENYTRKAYHVALATLGVGVAVAWLTFA